MKEIKLSIAEFTETIKALRDAERGRLLSAMLEYARTGAEPELSGNELYTWGAVKAAVDKQRKFYENKVAGAEKARAKKLISVDINPNILDINPHLYLFPGRAPDFALGSSYPTRIRPLSLELGRAW